MWVVLDLQILQLLLHVDDSRIKGTIPTIHAESAKFNATFELVTSYMCQNTVVLGMLKDESLLIHSLTLFICFTYKPSFKWRNSANNMSKMVNIVTFF